MAVPQDMLERLVEQHNGLIRLDPDLVDLEKASFLQLCPRVIEMTCQAYVGDPAMMEEAVWQVMVDTLASYKANRVVGTRGFKPL